MMTLQELEKREQEVKLKLEEAESLDERRELRSELREIRKKIFDAPTKTITPQKQSSVHKSEDKKSLNMSSSNKILDDNNNNAPITRIQRSPINISLKTSQEDQKNTINKRITVNGGLRNSDIATVNKPGTNITKTFSIEKKEDSKTFSKPATMVTKTFSIDKTKTTTTTPAEPNKFSLKPTGGGGGEKNTEIRRTPTWSHKNQGNVANKFEKFGAKVGQSPFQFGIDFNAKEKQTAPDSGHKRFSFNKYTPTVQNKYVPTHSTPNNFSSGIQSNTSTYQNKYTPTEQQNNGSVATQVTPSRTFSQTRTNENSPQTSTLTPTQVHTGMDERESKKTPSVNKYCTPITNQTSALKNDTADHKPIKKSYEFGLDFTVKKENDTNNQDERKTSSAPTEKTSESSSTSSPARNAPSFNKYNAPLKRNDKSAAASCIMRSVSMKVKPTFESAPVNNAPPEPSISFARNKFQQMCKANENEEAKVHNRSYSTSAIQQKTSPAKTSSYTSRFAPSMSSAPPPQPPPPEKKETPNENATSSLAFGAGGAADRMAFFRQAAEKEKEAARKKKEREEQRQKQIDAVNALVNGEIQQDNAEDNKGVEEENGDSKKKNLKKEMSDSEKMKYASAPCMKKREKKKIVRRTMSIGSIVLEWVQEMIKDYPVEVTNFTTSWNNGMAFCALIHRFNPDEFDFSELKPENKRHNFDMAFKTGLKVKNIPILLDTEDMVVMTRPEPRSVQTYIQWIWSVYGPTSGFGPTPKEVQK